MFSFRRFYLLCLPLLTFVFAHGYVFGQSEPNDISQVLDEEILTPVSLCIRSSPTFSAALLRRPRLRMRRNGPSRRSAFANICSRMWCFTAGLTKWVNSPPKFEDVGVVETGQGYRLRKLRYEIVPGFQSVAILYEP